MVARYFPYFRRMVLVTGSTGIVGARLVFDLLKQGKAVRAMKRAGSDLAFVRRVFRFYDAAHGDALFDGVAWVDGDVLDIASLEEAMEGVEQVYHSAALVSYSSRDAERLIEVNTEGTANVVNVALTAKVAKLCHISSVAAIGKAKSGPADENTEWKRSDNRSIYGMSKYLAEREVWRASAEGLPCVIVNPSVILGPSKPDQSSGMLMHFFRKGVPYYPSGAAGFVDVRDVSSMAIALMAAQRANQRYLLNAETIAYRDMLTFAASTFGNNPPTVKVQPWMLELAWPLAAIAAAFTGRAARITKETARNASQTLPYSNEKVRKALDANFIPVRESLAYYKGFFA